MKVSGDYSCPLCRLLVVRVEHLVDEASAERTADQAGIPPVPAGGLNFMGIRFKCFAFC